MGCSFPPVNSNPSKGRPNPRFDFGLLEFVFSHLQQSLRLIQIRRGHWGHLEISVGGKKAFLFPISCVLGNELHVCVYPTEKMSRGYE